MGMLRLFVMLHFLTVCVFFSLMEAFSKVLLIDLFIRITEVLGAVEAMVMIHLDFKGNTVVKSRSNVFLFNC